MTFLATAFIKVEYNQQFTYARALLDCGSQCNFIASRLVKLIDSPVERIHTPITGIGGSLLNASQITTIKISSRTSDYNRKVQLLVLPKLTAEIPDTDVNVSSLNIPENIQLADPKFNMRKRIEIILGIEYFHNIVKQGRLILSTNEPALVETVFGWVVIGRWLGQSSSTATCVTAAISHAPLMSAIEQFWHLENINLEKLLTETEAICEKHYETTTQRWPKRKYVVRIPRNKDSTAHLGESRSIAPTGTRYCNQRRISSIHGRICATGTHETTHGSSERRARSLLHSTPPGVQGIEHYYQGQGSVRRIM